MRLILIRHAKSNWNDPFQDDHTRVLNKRGRDAARAIGTWLQTKGYKPDCILVSDAMRTIETAALILPCLKSDPTVSYLPALYNASPDTVLDIAQRSTGGCVAIIAHNPGIGMVARALTTKTPDHRRFDDYPTCATTVIDFNEPITIGNGTLIDFVVPRDLIGASGRELN